MLFSVILWWKLLQSSGIKISKVPYPSNNCRAGAGYTGMFSCRGLLSSECGETSFSIRVEKSEAEASQNQPNSAYKIKVFKSRGAIMDICIYITA